MWKYKTPLEPKDCARCGSALPLLRSHKIYFCKECKVKAGPIKNGRDAHGMVRAAIRFGYLRPASEYQCVDCGSAAECYDHRDYNKPLDVEPVCIGCNVRRGPAIHRRSESKAEAT